MPTSDLYVVTFNCGRNYLNPDTFAPRLFDAYPSSHAVPDILAISLQEVAPIAYSFLGGSFLAPYFDQVTRAVNLAVKLRSDGGENLQHVRTRSLGMTAIMVFAKPKIAEKILWIQSAGAGLGLWTMGNKGAVAVRIGFAEDELDAHQNGDAANVPQSVLTLVSAHLTHAEQEVEARNEDWKTASRNLVFWDESQNFLYTFAEDAEQPLLGEPYGAPPEGRGIYEDSGNIFVAGDLNYRTHDTAPNKTAHLNFPQPHQPESSPTHYSALLKTDQLNRERTANRTLHGFYEAQIKFPPTYKYSHERPPSSEDEYWSWAPHRWPSYCDRILYLLARSPKQSSNYTALPLQSTSDHRPVALSMRIDLQPLSKAQTKEVQSKRPFPINPNWYRRKVIGRCLELVVGALSYLALTRKGNAMAAVAAGLLVGFWWIGLWIRGA